MRIITRLREEARKLKVEVYALSIAYSDKRTPVLAKIMVGITVAYLLSPIDLIPDFIPILGLLDDLIIVPALIALSIKLIPAEVLAEARVKVQNSKISRGPVSWILAGLILAVWALSLFFGIRYLILQMQ
jgi:uncharacterized membrane protein YkvA (DUF1232 family)